MARQCWSERPSSAWSAIRIRSPAPLSPCSRAYLIDRPTGTIRRLAIPAAAGIPSPQTGTPVGTVDSATLTSDGRYVTVTLSSPDDFPLIPILPSYPFRAVVLDRLTL